MHPLILELSDVAVISKKNRLRWGKGRAYKDPKALAFEEELSATARLAVATAPGSWPLRGPIKLQIGVCQPDKRRRDLQNWSDTICDALNGVVYEDDSQVVKLEMQKTFGSEWWLQVVVTPL